MSLFVPSINQGPEEDAVLLQEVCCRNDSMLNGNCNHFLYALLSLPVSVPFCSPSLAARADHAVLLRKYVSRQSAGKGRAVLEGVGFDVQAIHMFYLNNLRNEEEAVQAGLLEWVASHHATWEVLIGAMEHGHIAMQYIDKLKEELQKGVCTCAYISSQ